MHPVLALIIANIIWGFASPIFKYALTDIPPFTLAFIRFFVASLLFLPFIRWQNIQRLAKRDIVDIILGLSFFGVFINITFFFMGLMRTESINAPVIASTGPLLLFVFSVLVLHETPKVKVLAGMSVAFLGALVIIFAPLFITGNKIDSIGKFEGNLLLIVATLGSVVSPILLKRVLSKIDCFLVTGIGFFVSSFGFLPFMIGELQTWQFSQLHAPGIIGIMFGVVFSSAIAYFLFMYGVSKIQTQEVGVFTYIDPIAAVILAAFLLKEYPNPAFIIGSILIFAGILIAERRLHYHPIKRLLAKHH